MLVIIESLSQIGVIFNEKCYFLDRTNNRIRTNCLCNWNQIAVFSLFLFVYYQRTQTSILSSATSSTNSAPFLPSFARNSAVFLSFLVSTVDSRGFFDIDHVFLIPRDCYVKGREIGHGCSGKVFEGYENWRQFTAESTKTKKSRLKNAKRRPPSASAVC